VDTRFLDSLIAVVENGSIAGAARQQGLTSAAVSQRVIALEKELGCKLLSRSSHVAKPTEACLNILKRAHKIVRETEDLKSDIDTSILTGTLKIGAISTALTGILPSALRKLSEIAPQVIPVITPGASKFLYEGLKNEKLDAAILVDPPFDIPKSFVKYILHDEPLLFISKEKRVNSIKDILTTEAFIRYDSKSWGGRFANSFLFDNNIHTKLFCELDALEAICILVSKDMGVSLVPRWMGIEKYSNKIYIKKIPEKKYNRKVVLIVSSQTNRQKKINKLKEALNI
jgi:DNA-binding transcriptional LysR family regulator